MTISTGHSTVRLQALLFSCLLTLSLTLCCFAVDARAEAPLINIAKERQALWDQYRDHRAQIREDLRAGRITEKEAQELVAEANQQRFAEARARGKAIEDELNAIKKRTAQIRMEQLKQRELLTGKPQKFEMDIRNTGTPLTDPASRGIFGDQDLTFASDADRAAFVQAAKERGYSISGKLGEGYVSIDALDIVAHGPSEVHFNPMDPQARLQTHYRASGHESFAARGSRYPYLKEGSVEWSGRDALGAVTDNIKKVEHDLGRDLASLQGLKQEESIQNLAKGTMRAMVSAGKSEDELAAALAAAQQAGETTKATQIEKDLAFLKRLKSLKSNMDPRATGLIPIAATDDEARLLLQQFQEKCLTQYHEAYQTGLARNRRLIAEMDSTISRLLKSGRGKEAAELLMERSAIIDGVAQSIQYLATSKRSKDGLTHGARLLAEVISGKRLTSATNARGIKGYIDASGRFISDAELRAVVGDQVINEARAALTNPKPPKGISKFERGMLYLQAIMAGIEGASQERTAAEAEGRDPSNVLAVLRAWWAMTGIQQGYETGAEATRQATEEEFARINEMIQRGEKPNLYWAEIRRLAKSLGYTAGELTGASGILRGGAEFIGLIIEDAYNEMSGPPGDVDALVRQRADALVSALDNELSELNAMLPTMAELLPDAQSAVAELDKAITPLDNAIRGFEQLDKDVKEYDRLCTANNISMQEIDALRQDILTTTRQAEDLSLQIYRNGAALCRSAPKTDTALSPSAVRIPPKGFSEDWMDLREIHSRHEQTIESLTAKRAKLHAMVKEFNDNNAKLELLAINARPMRNAGTLPDLLDEVRINAELASKPVLTLNTLSKTIASRARGIRRRAEMLYHAKVMEERAVEYMAEADEALDTLKTYRAQELAKKVSAAFDIYPAEADRLTEKAENYQAIMRDSCGAPIEDLDASDIDLQADAAATVYAQAGKSYNEARGCAERVLGSMAVPLSPKPEGQATGTEHTATGHDKPKEEKPWENTKFERPIYLYRYKKSTERVSLMYAHTLYDKDTKGLYKIPDSFGGYYHEDVEVSGPYGDAAAVCAVLRGYGVNSVSYIGGRSSVQCPQEGPTAQPTLMDAQDAATTGQGGIPPAGGHFLVGSASGQVQILSSTGATQALGGGGDITPGSTIQTGADGRVTLRSPQGTSVIIGPKTKAQTELEEGGKHQVFNLLEGSIDVSHTGRAPDDVMVRSVDGTVVADGTKYRVEKDASGTRVQVFEGSVRLTGSYIIRTYAPGVEHGKPAPVKEMRLTAGQQALMVRLFAKPSVPSWMQDKPAGSPTIQSSPGKSSKIPSWLASGQKPTAPSSPLSLPDPWNNAQVQGLMDQWIRQAVPPSNTPPGVVMHYNEWLQPLSQAARSTGPPDHPADWTRYRYLWENRTRYGSTNLCTLGEFLELTLSGKGTAGCVTTGNSRTATPSWVTTSNATPTSSRKPDDLVEQARQELSEQQAPPPKKPQRLAAVPSKPVARPKPLQVAPPTTTRPSDDIVMKPKPHFTGNWQCVITNSDGATAQSNHSIYRDKSGTYQMYIPKADTRFPAQYVNGNRIGFMIGDGTTDKTIYLDFEVNGNKAAGTDRVEHNNGTTVTYSIRCTRETTDRKKKGKRR